MTMSRELVTRADREAAVLDWLRRSLEDPDISGSDNFLDVGGHSLAFARLSEFVRERFGAVIDIQTMYEKSISEACAAATPA